MAAARASFERAVTFLRSGDAGMAEKICRAALDDYPDDVNFLSVLGAALTQLGRPNQAEKALQRAVSVDPTYAKAHEELGAALIAQRRFEESLGPLRSALRLDPGLESAEIKLSHALLALGRRDEARVAFDGFLNRSPHRRRLAIAAEDYREGRLEEAETVCREILRLDPKEVSAIRLLGLIALRVEHYRDAAILLQQAVALAPDYRAAWLDLGRARTELYELDEAIECAQRAIDLAPERASGYIGLGNALARSSRTEEAIAAYEKAAGLQPAQAGTYLGLGNVLKTVGRQADAISAYRAGIRLRPTFAELYWSLSNLKTFRFEADEVKAMQGALEDPELPGEDVVHFCFALGKHYDDIADYDRAFELYDRGNRVRRAMESYDPVQTELIGRRIRAVFTRELLERSAGAGHPGVRPIFIVGLPRSGSTLLEQILASHSLVETTHELPEAGRLVRFVDRQRVGGKTYPEAVASLSPEMFAELGQRYDRETARYRSGAPVFVDKMPNNFALVGLLHLALPNARFINARRDPLDTCLSCYKQLFARGQSFTYDLLELGEYYLEYERMIEHWRDALPGQVLDVHYEDVVSNTESEIRRILDYCGLPWEDNCLRFYETERPIRTASSEQVRQPIYRNAVGQWRHYEAHLGPLIETLAPFTRRVTRRLP